MDLDGEKTLVRVIVAWNGPESLIPPKGYIDEKHFFHGTLNPQSRLLFLVMNPKP